VYVKRKRLFSQKAPSGLQRRWGGVRPSPEAARTALELGQPGRGQQRRGKSTRPLFWTKLLF
jgi:hypothetical protein